VGTVGGCGGFVLHESDPTRWAWCTEYDPVAYVVSPFKRRDGTIPLRPIRSHRMTWLIVFFFDTSQAGSVLTSEGK